ncbi:MAG: molybdenum ABC transporter ATP-binding protein [Pseudomonadota bacterium]
MNIDVALRKQMSDFTLDIAFTAGEGVTALFGRSGAGKSTILKVIAGLVHPDAGRITLGDRVLFDHVSRVDVPVHKRSVGLVFQDARLFPHKSVLGNLCYGVRASGGEVTRADALSMAKLLGLEDRLKHRPAQLSGGEAQRVAIGRALLSKPQLLMLDEPLSGLDQARKADVLALLEKLRDAAGVPILYVSHQRDEVLRLARHAVVIADGKVIEQGPPAAVLGLSAQQGLARTLKARLIMKNSADGLSELSISGGKLIVPQVNAALGDTVEVEICARDVMLSLVPPDGLSALNTLACDITEVRPSTASSSSMDVHLACGTDTLVAQITKRSVGLMALEPGQPIYAVVKAVALADPSGALQPVDL